MVSARENTTSPFLEPLPLKGGFSLADRILPAPMEGILTPLFTKALAQQGHVKAWITPFYRVSNGQRPRLWKMKRDIQFFLDTQIPVIVQLLGTDPDLISLVAEGFSTFEGVIGLNFNFACPSRRVNQRGGGGACLQTPKLMYKIIQTTQQRCPGISLSAKIRTGYQDPDECHDILPGLRDSGCEWVSVHHRTVMEAYTRVDDRLARLAMAKQAWGKLPLLASGDVFGVEDVLELEASGVCQGLLIARGLIRKPLLLGEARLALGDPNRQHRGDHFQREQAYEFMETILKLSHDNPAEYWAYSYAMELARCLFGHLDPTFRALTTFSQQDGPLDLLNSLMESKMRDPRLMESKMRDSGLVGSLA